MLEPPSHSYLLVVPMVALNVYLTTASAGAPPPEPIWVDNTRGSDEASSSREEPYKTVDRALRALKPGGKLNFVPNDVPYVGEMRIPPVGTADGPVVIDGHGAVVTGLKHRKGDEWEDEGADVFSIPLPNNAFMMERHWEGGFPIAFFDGKPGQNCTSLDSLQPLGYFLYKNRKEQRSDPRHNTLYIKLPPGKTPETAEVKTVSRCAIYAGKHTIVRNFTVEWGSHDGYDTFRSDGAVFENCEARLCMDNGISHHGSPNVVVRNGWFHDNAGCGIVDVMRESSVRYENCLIENDSWRGGVEFHSGQYEMENCIIRHNVKKGLIVVRGARVRLKNCVLIGKDGKTPGVVVRDGGLTMENCTLFGFDIAVAINAIKGTRVDIERCAFINCGTNYRLVIMQWEGKDFEPWQVLRSDHNYLTPAPSSVSDRRQSDGRWAVKNSDFPPEKWRGFVDLTGFDAKSTVRKYQGKDTPYALPGLRDRAGRPIGADVDPNMRVGPRGQDSRAEQR